MKSGIENYINKNKRRKGKDKSILDFLPLFFPPLPSRLPKLSIDFGDTNSAPRFTHTQLHPRTPSSKQSGYICSSICRCVTEHRLIVLEIYIYIYLGLNYPRCQTTRSTHPIPLWWITSVNAYRFSRSSSTLKIC